MTTVLIAEDDHMLLAAMAKLFKLRGYAVQTAASGNIAIRILQTAPIDIVISDYYMPDGDGRHLLDHVRGMPAKRLPFILITGQADMRVDAFKELGVDELLLKPFPIPELVAMVARYTARP